MGDHWKSLANKLGAPGVDAPIAEPTTEAVTPPISSLAGPPAKKVRVPEPERVKPEGKAPTDWGSLAAESTTVSPKIPSPRPTRAQPLPERQAAIQPPAQISPAQISPAQTSPAQTSPAQPTTAGPAKPKRKSSWDTLTSIFGINSSAPTHAVEPAIAAESTTALKPEASVNSTKTTALDQLFGDAPRQELSWQKPTPSRIIDDVSGWDAPAVKNTARSNDVPDSNLEIDASNPVEGDDADTPVRRRRRRRRGGRRDRDEVVDGSDRTASSGREPSDSVRPPRPTRASSDHSRRESESIKESELEGDDWEVPDTHVTADDWVEPEVFEGQRTDVDEDARPERRSNRRRRRGVRNRDRTDGTSSSQADAVANIADDSPDSRVRGPSREPSSREPRVERPPREPREVRQGRRPRSESELPARTRSPRAEPHRELAVTSSDDDEVDSSLAAELEEVGTGPNRHPKIPTWNDSLDAIIAANMENHRRSDSRGGPARGRPRGGGGGGGGGGSRR